MSNGPSADRSPPDLRPGDPRSRDLAPGDLARGDLARGDLARGDLARGDLARRDLAHVDFDPPDWARPFLSAIDGVAADIGQGRAGLAAAQALQVGDLVMDLAPDEAVAMLFLAAERLARVDTALAWATLWAIPGQAGVGDGSACDRPILLAIPSRASDARVVAIPMGALAHARVLDPLTGGLLAPAVTHRIERDWAEGDQAEGNWPQGNWPQGNWPQGNWPQGNWLQGNWAETLAGFPDWRLLRIARPPAPAQPAACGRAMGELTSALFGGLLAGTAARVASAAFAHARTRLSAGRPLAQHQAVGLRLADIAIHTQALVLDLGFAFCNAAGGRAETDRLHGGHVADLAFRVARDSLQVAGAHGYVAGLPFKDAFLQIRTLGTLLSWQLGAWPDVALPPAAPRREPVAAT